MLTMTSTMVVPATAFKTYVVFAKQKTAEMKYESFASVAARKDGRWRSVNLADLLSPSTSTAPIKRQGKLSQKQRRRQKKQQNATDTSANDSLEPSALELCMEFLTVAELQSATMVCTAFRDVISHSHRLLLGNYSHEWRMERPLPSPYMALSYRQQLKLCLSRKTDTEYQLSTRSLVKRNDNGTALVRNNSMLRSFDRGCIDSVRGVTPLKTLACSAVLGHNVVYFEAEITGGGSVGVVSVSDAASRSAYGFGSDKHVGWDGISYGYHGNDGDFVYNDGAITFGGKWEPLGKPWGSNGRNVIGCGVDYERHRVFFTLNGELMGSPALLVQKQEYAAAVSLHDFDDCVAINYGTAPYQFDIEGFCASL